MTSPVIRLGISAPETARRLTAALLARDDVSLSSQSHLRVLQIRTWDVEPEDGAEQRAEAVRVAREAGEQKDLANALISSAMSAAGPVEIVREDGPISPYLVEAGELVGALDGPSEIALVYHNAVGIQSAQRGDHVGAKAAYETSLQLALASGDDFNIGVATYNLAELDEIAGDDGAALAGYALAARIFLAGDYHLYAAHSALATTGVCERTGDLAAAGDWAADAVLAARRSGSRGLLGAVLATAARIAVAAGDVSVATAGARELLALDPESQAGRDLLAQLAESA